MTEASPTRFRRYIGIDYSGAKTARKPVRGLRVYVATHESGPLEETTKIPRHKYWTRAGLTDWLAGVLAEQSIPTLVGIDHAFSFPVAYFERYQLEWNWPNFLEDFCRHWPTAGVVSPPEARKRSGRERLGDGSWYRKTEEVAKANGYPAKSPFRFHVNGTVAHSTHAGIPHLLELRRRLDRKVFFWPFEGWAPPDGGSVIAEVYPALWNRREAEAGLTPDQRDARCVAAAFRRLDAEGKIQECFESPGGRHDRWRVEGWILGVLDKVADHV